MTTITTEFEIIDRVRRRYLAAHPLRFNTVPTINVRTGEPAGEITIPHPEDIGIVGCKLGAEYLAVCHDDEAVEAWIRTVKGVGKENQHMAGVLYANIFRGINTLIGSIIEDADMCGAVQQFAIQAWGLDPSELPMSATENANDRRC